MKMIKIKEKFEMHKNSASDINEHLETIREYTSKCNIVIEMGVRWVVTTWAFLYGNPKKMISYDIYTDNAIN